MCCNYWYRKTFCYSDKKGNGLDTCYSVTYMSKTRDQQRFTISEVAADWHEPIDGAAANYVAIHCPR